MEKEWQCKKDYQDYQNDSIYCPLFMAVSVEAFKGQTD